MADSSFITSDTGSTGTGEWHDTPIVVGAVPYSATLAEIPMAVSVWFKVRLPAGVWELATTDSPDAQDYDTSLSLFSEGGAPLEYSEDMSGADYRSSIIVAVSSPGYYYLALAGSGAVPGSGPNLSASRASVPAGAVLTIKPGPPPLIANTPSVRDTLSWPVVMRRKFPEVGETLTGTVPELSPDLAAAPWAAVEGDVGPAHGAYISWADTSRPAFRLQESGEGQVPGPAVVSLPLALGSNRGLAVYLGFSITQQIMGGNPVPDFWAAPSFQLELLDAQGAVVATLATRQMSGFGLGGDAGLKATLFAAGSSKFYEAVIGSRQTWENPWTRTLVLVIAADGSVAAGYGHPEFDARFGLDPAPARESDITPGYYPKLGRATAANIESARLRISGVLGLTFMEVRKLGMRPIPEPLGIWWRDRVHVVEWDPEGESGPPKDDWRGLS